MESPGDVVSVVAEGEEEEEEEEAALEGGAHHHETADAMNVGRSDTLHASVGDDQEEEEEEEVVVAVVVEAVVEEAIQGRSSQSWRLTSKHDNSIILLK